jgi:signal transduction histidine kinase
MSLRLRLVLALVSVALVAILIALAVPLGQAERRARTEAEGRLAQARRQAAALVLRSEAEAAARFARLLEELAADEAVRLHLLRGPETAATAELARVAARSSVERLEVGDDRGMRLGVGLASGGRRLPFRHEGPLPIGGETLRAVAWSSVGPEWLRSIADVAGCAARLVDDEGGTAQEAGAPPANALTADVLVGQQGWRVRIAVGAGDVREIRRETWANFLRLAPLALGGALLAGLFLAHTIARPVRALTERAEEIARGRARPILLPEDRDEVRRLATAIEQLLDALEGSERQRLAAERRAAWDEVARRIAHEVRNPLSPIQLAVENLRRTRQRAPEHFDRALEEETEAILEEVQSLRRLVDEFSEFARLPRPTFAAESPRELVQRALGLFRPRIERSGVAVRAECDLAPPQVACDAEQVGRVLKNVLANALDALEGVSERSLGVTVAASGPDTAPVCDIVIRDSGVGLTEEAARRAFEPYFTTKQARGGTGLGMAIACRIVEEHGGTIAIEGHPGGGATVTIRLPVRGPRSA